MKISHLTVANWRNFSGIELAIPADSPVVCLVGENGTGKSNLLELIAAVAVEVGISPGIELYRGNPLQEPHELTLTVSVGGNLNDLFAGTKNLDWATQQKLTWNGSLLVKSQCDQSGKTTTTIEAGGCDPAHAKALATRIRDVLRARKTIHHLFLDADRSYPPVAIENHEYAAVVQRDWDSDQWKRMRAVQPTRTLYKEWIEYFVATESQAATRHTQEERRAVTQSLSRPPFVDHFKPFKDSLVKVLPHLKFEGVDMIHRTLNFDTAGLPLKFTQLSGGEREIAFLIGQIERFQLRDGLLLIDEPELHLNPDLIRIWIAFLRDTVTDGQFWIATHSLEAVEVAGRSSSFVLQRKSGTRRVERADALQDRPMLSALTAALGSPGFSISRRRFTFIEGERGLGERERFHKLLGEPEVNRFMEAGGCRDVTRKVAAVKELAAEADETVRVGGILDRDFREPKELQRFSQEPGIVVLPCHEIENFFLHPATLESIAFDHGVSTPAECLIVEAADKFAGGWVQQRAFARLGDRVVWHLNFKIVAWTHDWKKIAADKNAFVAAVVASAHSTEDKVLIEGELNAAIAAYEKDRATSEFWKKCMGKQALTPVASTLGLVGADFLEQAVTQKWLHGRVPTPVELDDLRKKVSAI